MDDTGARHQAQNGFCTQIGDNRLTTFGTTGSKSRLNFLGLLRPGHTDFVLKDIAFAYMREHGLSKALIGQLAEHPESRFSDPGAWKAHLKQLGLDALSVTPSLAQIATEGALWGAVHTHIFLRDAVVVSDGAGQFDVGQHALCWVHAERLSTRSACDVVHKLDTFTNQHRAARKLVRGMIWRFYTALKTYRLKPSPRRCRVLRAWFDRIFLRQTGFATLDRLLARLHANKDKLRRVLERPEIPLHTNG